MITKTIKTPLVMSEAFGHTHCSSTHVAESKLSHTVQVQYGFVPKLRHRRGKNIENLFSQCAVFLAKRCFCLG